MKGQETLYSIAFVVSILVIIGMAIIFSVLFSLYGHYKTKHIKDGHEDDLLRKQIYKKYKKVIDGKKLYDEEIVAQGYSYKLIQDMDKIKTYINEPDKSKNKVIPAERPVTVFESITQNKEKNKKYRIFLDIVSGIFYFAFAVLLCVAVAFKVQNMNFYFGDTTYLTIQTPSMEEVAPENKYVEENNLTDQITQYSLIGIDKVNCDEDIELYDIIAFKHKDTIFVHRVIRKYYNEVEKKMYYSTRGDANSQSMSFELMVTCDQIIGVYNGFQNYGLGVTLIYLQSQFGIVSLLAGFLFLLTYNISEATIEKNYYSRILKISKEIDNELGFKIELKEKKA